MSDLSIVFMGTPEFATGILAHLFNNNINIKAVITAPDKPAGRGQKIHQSDVKKFAIEQNLKVLQPTNLKDSLFIDELEKLEADLFVVVAFRMLPEVVWSMPRLGTINLHASLLPNYRGAAPINWAIINGEKKTGVTTFFIEKEIDTGDLIEQREVSIGENENVGELYQRLKDLGARVVYNTIKSIESNNLNRIKQASVISDTIHPAPKIFKADCEIDFNGSVVRVHNFCRGLSPFPGAWCLLYNKEKDESKSYKILSTLKTSISCSNTQSLKEDEEGLLIPCNDFYIRVLEIQPEGKRKMDAKSFLAGNSIENLTITRKSY